MMSSRRILLSSLRELGKRIQELEALYDEWSYFVDHEAASEFLEELEHAQRRASLIMVQIQVIELEARYDEYSYFVDHEAALPLLEKAEKLQVLIDKGEVPHGENSAEEVRSFLNDKRRKLC